MRIRYLEWSLPRTLRWLHLEKVPCCSPCSLGAMVILRQGEDFSYPMQRHTRPLREVSKELLPMVVMKPTTLARPSSTRPFPQVSARTRLFPQMSHTPYSSFPAVYEPRKIAVSQQAGGGSNGQPAARGPQTGHWVV